ncbi:ArsR family transcriptional regulator [Gemmata sp.]|uniref:ArsR family transcriptional regulator n=1 Tax=Gemmata sp. TaxID=1914242 RepID=UPI003F71ABCE
MSTEQGRVVRLAGVSEWLATIQEHHRMATLLELASGPKTVAELAAATGAAAGNLGQHLLRLRRVRLVDSTATGLTRTYRLTGVTVTPRALELTHPAGVRVTLDRAALAATLKGKA